MSDDRTIPAWAIWLVTGLSVAVVYVFSAGPALLYGWEATLVHHQEAGWVSQVYAPVFWLNEHTVLSYPLGWYFGFWLSFATTPALPTCG